MYVQRTKRTNNSHNLPVGIKKAKEGSRNVTRAFRKLKEHRKEENPRAEDVAKEQALPSMHKGPGVTPSKTNP